MTQVEVAVPNKKGVLVHCTNSKCQYKWQYKGLSIFYASCPRCRHNVKIQETKIESLRSAQVGRQSQTAAVATTSAKELTNYNE